MYQTQLQFTKQTKPSFNLCPVLLLFIILKNVSTHTHPQLVGRVNLKWENEHKDRLSDILRDLLEKGIRPLYRKRIIPRIAQSLNNQLNDGTQYTE